MDKFYDDPIMGRVRVVHRDQTPDAKPRKRKPVEFYLLRKTGMVELGKVLGGHWPSIQIAMEAVRLAATKKGGRLRLSYAKAAELGITLRGLQTAKRRLFAAGHWFDVEGLPGKAVSVSPTGAAMAALRYARK